MRRRVMIGFMIYLSLLVGCTNEGTEDSSGESMQEENESIEEEQEEQEESEDVTEAEPSAEETPEEEPAEDEESEQDTDIDVEQVLLRAAEAMGEWTSMKMESEIVSNQSNQFQESTISWKTVLEIKNAENYRLMHEFVTVEDDRGEPMNLELYVTPDYHYTQNVDHAPGVWTKEAAFMGGYQHFNLLTAGNVMDYASKADYFTVVEEADHYKVALADGNDDVFKEHIFFAFAHPIDEVIQNSDSDVDMTGTFEMTIEKETMYVTRWEMTFDAKTTTDETGEYHNVEEATYLFSDVNGYDGVDIPDEVIQSAD